MLNRTTYTKRASQDAILIELAVQPDKLLGDSYPVSATIACSPAGPTTGTPTPLAKGIRFSFSGGTSSVDYTVTATITLSDGRIVTELTMVTVFDDTVAADPTVAVEDYPPEFCFTNRKWAEAMLSKQAVALRLDNDGNGGVDPVERRTIAYGAYIATGWVRRRCSTIHASELAKSWGVVQWATVYYARWLCLREGNPPPPGIEIMYQEAMEELTMVAKGQLQLEDITPAIDPGPSWSNMRVDPLYGVQQQRVQKQISDRSKANFRRKQDTGDLLLVEPDV